MSLLRFSLAGPIALALVLAACGERELILEGERLDLRAPLGDETGTGAEALPGSAAFGAPGARSNADWTQLGGSASRSTENYALGAGVTRLWSAPIGAGNSRGHRITAAPVVAQGRVFTVDSRARVTAVSTGGAVLWSADMTPPTDRADDASGAGLAVGGGRLFATTGFGELSAFDVATGARAWTQDLGAVATGAPTVLGDRVFVSGRDGRGWAIDAATGQVLWTIEATAARSGVIGGPSPAATADAVVFPFASGELIAVAPDTGATIWSAYVLGERIGRVFARIRDITGDPVIQGGTVYAGSHSGRTAAIEFGTGRTLWTADYGAMSHVAVAGGSVFLISDDAQLVRLDAATGAPIWEQPLPYFTRDRLRRRKDIFAHYGPILAGGRLVIASDDGLLRYFSPEDGTLLSTAEIPGGAASDPVVAGGTLYAVSENGQLNAFR